MVKLHELSRHIAYVGFSYPISHWVSIERQTPLSERCSGTPEAVCLLQYLTVCYSGTFLCAMMVPVCMLGWYMSVC